ncbi:MAG: excinuclease ABC subunit UvrA [Rhodocyclaceae bacterium]|nr:excinuclease ABC subunit UvrA [Rhodocyclaceae bacterium]
MNEIKIRGARTHNLKNINLDLPRHQLIVITGLSGSGKSSLAFDTLYAEGQRRYVESLSAYARQFLQLMEKPDVDLIEGLSPAISIEQKAASHNPRSTVGTVTEIHDYLRLLYARAGTPYCPEHGEPLEAMSIAQMVDHVLALPVDTKLMILAPVVANRKGEQAELFADLKAQGFVRLRVDGIVHDIDALPLLAKSKKHSVDVVIDRLKVKPEMRTRLAESFETALRHADGRCFAVEMDSGLQHLFSAKFACPHCGYALHELEPRLFSFNSPMGACRKCDGLGVIQIQGGSAEGEEVLTRTCPVCEGARLRREACHVRVGGRTIIDLNRLPLTDCREFFNHLQLTGQKAQVAEKIIHEITARLSFLINVGLNYLSLDRSAETLSGGESQRIRLASQIGSGLTGVLYVLDEPSIGLHQRDNARLLETLRNLRDHGNTVIVVEHDQEAIETADHVVDMGPGAGVHGGYVVALGTPAQIAENPRSLTGDYLSGRRKIALPTRRTPSDPHRQLKIFGAVGNNLKSVDLSLPIGLLTCITGVSGSGKSTLINDTLHAACARHLYGSTVEPAPYDRIEGLDFFDKIVCVDQAPIGRTPRSNPATYTGVMTPLRELFAGVPSSRERGYAPGRFSFNVKGGRCEACQGDGLIKVAMHFLPDIYVPCDICHGQRYNRETLEIRYKGKTIFEILQMTVEQARAFFDPVPVLARKLQTLMDVGLSYITLGQSATTLSGGEAQRVKLALELSKRDTGRTLTILDEPTTGLHFQDIEMLLTVLHRLRNAGNTIVVIEHNLDVIKTADWIIDLGPEGGEGGGRIIAEGPPETVANIPESHTGQHLARLLTGMANRHPAS